MTHSTRNQRKFALSVRTRALLHKYHERLTRRIGSCEMRLRTRTSHPTPCVVSGSETNDTHIDSALQTIASKFDIGEQNDVAPSVSYVESSAMDHRASVNRPSSSACSTTSTESGSVIQCKWDGCSSSLDESELVTHIQQSHVTPQMISNRRKFFVCLWKDCRVYRRPSVSAAWLESHILHHTNAKGKPFRCIFDGCSLRFSTSILLERHVQRAHMRVTRTQTGSLPTQSPTNDIVMADYHTDRNTNEANNKMNDSPNHTIKRSFRRRRKPRAFRVRRADFYDKRSQQTIQNRLKLGHLLGSNTSTEMLSTIDRLPQKPLPKPLVWPLSKPRLRSAISPPPSPLEKSGQTKTTDTRQTHLAMLLTMPHVYIGQRLSDNNQLEVLVRWNSESCFNCPSATWISKEEIQVASRLGSVL